MQVQSDPIQVQAEIRAARLRGQVIGLVPTMGALHDGHLALVEYAKSVSGFVAVSIFVNPTQFGPNEDLDRYPKDLGADLQKLQSLGVDLVFAPSASQMYGNSASTWVHVEEADKHLCGPFRPGHFRGVTTVVAKLFNIIQPDKAVFGLKDAQQFLILRRMVNDLNFPVELIGRPTVRETDGLALSSRNVFLSPSHRKQAVVLSQAVAAAAKMIEDGSRDPLTIRRAMTEIVGAARDSDLQYAEIVDTESIAPIDVLTPGQQVVAALAVFFGTTRLIDNAFVTVPGQPG